MATINHLLKNKDAEVSSYRDQQFKVSNQINVILFIEIQTEIRDREKNKKGN